VRLTNEETQHWVACLAALKHQRHALANRIDDVKGLLHALEVADDEAVRDHQQAVDCPYGRNAERTASAS